MKAFRIFFRSIRDAFKSVFRNFSLSMASILCATITLMVVAISLLIAGNVNSITKDLESELSIVVYLEESAKEDDISFLESKIKAIKGVEEVIYKSNEERELEMSEYSSSYATIFESYEDSPLLNTFIITVDDAEKLNSIAEEIKVMDNVESALYGENSVDTIVEAFSFIEKVTVIVVIALVFVTAFLITNTIKLAIYARRSEIEIMRLVGASNMAIKLPFVFEGFIIGILGSFIPIIIIIYGYIIIYEKMGGHIISNIVNLINPYNFVFDVGIIILLLGAIIGMFGSLNAVRKYLKI
ncbi:MAG: permease-like cell division protein FtsX [Bacilli bacterium]|nr:permease-like cell division protein FtsX [Bacilli bacterium]